MTLISTDEPTTRSQAPGFAKDVGGILLMTVRTVDYRISPGSSSSLLKSMEYGVTQCHNKIPTYPIFYLLEGD